MAQLKKPYWSEGEYTFTVTGADIGPHPFFSPGANFLFLTLRDNATGKDVKHPKYELQLDQLDGVPPSYEPVRLNHARMLKAESVQMATENINRYPGSTLRGKIVWKPNKKGDGFYTNLYMDSFEWASSASNPAQPDVSAFQREAVATTGNGGMTHPDDDIPF